jgi:uncharacterized protein YbbC (DUF1343 family)
MLTIAAIAAVAALTASAPADVKQTKPSAYRNGQTLTGIDVLEKTSFSQIAGRKVGLVTNHSGLTRDGRRSVDAMLKAGVQVVALFSPEHGFGGNLDVGGIKHSTDEATGITIYSLYGDTRKPTPEMLKGIDLLVFDMQDIGVRFYTYETTMAYCMEEAAKANIAFMILDRPNPITGTIVEGPLMDKENTSFTGYLAATPVRHGMTLAELAQMFNEEAQIGVQLEIVKMEDWQRDDWFESTNLMWIHPSPNMRSLKAAILYPGICFVEFPQNFSVGRGTDSPFEQIATDFVNGRELAAYLNERRIPGIRVYPTYFTPTESRFKGQRIEGVRFELVNRDLLDATYLGLEVCAALQRLYPDKIDWNNAGARRLTGSTDVVNRIKAGEDPRTIRDTFASGVREFEQKRRKWLLY